MRLIYSFMAFAMMAQGLFSSSFSSSAYAIQKPIEEYWRDVGLVFPAVRQTLSNQNCYASEESFNGCFEAMNAALAASHSSLKLVVTDGTCASLLKPGPGKNQIPKANFGPAQIVSAVESGPRPKSLAEATQQLKLTRLKHATELKGLYDLRKSYRRLNFEVLANWIDTNIVLHMPEHESFITASAINAYLGTAKDPHTYILPEAYFTAHNTESSEVIFGIGAQMAVVGGKMLVAKPMEGSPALAAGLKAKDEVLEIDGVPLVGKSFDESVAKIRGAQGTVVTLKILRGTNTLNIKVTRGEFVQLNVSYSVLRDAGMNVGYVHLKGFIEHSCDEIRNALLALQEKNVSSLVLDLRDNGGGMLEEANCIAGLFMGPEKAVVIEKYLDPNHADETQYTHEEQVTNLPLVTLINAGSASASEVIAGAFQDHERSVIVGDRSFGKATVQAIGPVPQPPGVVMARTIARFFQPSGRTNQIVGILPDVSVFSTPNPTEDEKIAFREEDEYSNALPKLGTPWVQPRPDYVAAIRRCMEESGVAPKLFASRQDDAIPPDFQLLTSQDILRCMEKHIEKQ